MAGCERQVDLSRRRLSDATLAGPVTERMEAGDDESMTAGAAHTKAWWSIAAWSGERGVRYRVRGRYFRSRASCVYVVHVIVKPVGLKKRRVRQRALMTRPPARAAAPRARARPPARARRPAPRRTPPRAPARAARHARAWRAPSSRVPPQAALAHATSPIGHLAPTHTRHARPPVCVACGSAPGGIAG